MFRADPRFGPSSRGALRRAASEGSLVACDVVWAEVAGVFPAPAAAAQAMELLGVAFGNIDRSAALTAGQAWAAYRRHGGKRERVVADFLIGAHALTHADRLLTRDRGFYHTYFRELTILDPT